MQETNSETKRIYCPVNLPVPYTLTLGDAATLKGQFEDTLKGFRDGMAKATPEILAQLEPGLIEDTCKAIETKIARLEAAMNSAKQAYARKQLAK